MFIVRFPSWGAAAVMLLVSATACGSDEERTSADEEETSATDHSMHSAMGGCVGDWMRQAAGAPEVDTATDSELSTASQAVLSDCGT